jgi:protein translocase SecG subunit
MLDMIFSLNTLWWILLFLYVPACLGLVLIVLLQKGKGVGFAGAFGAGPGGSDAVFGPRSSKSLPQKVTYTMAGIFMVFALVMSMISGNRGSSVAPELVPDTGVVPQESSGSGGIDALFSDKPVPAAETPAAADAPAATETTSPVSAVTVETPAPEAPAAEAPAPEAAPAAESPAAEAPAPDAAPATEAPAAPAAQ